MKKNIRFLYCVFFVFLTLPITSLLAIDHYVSPTGGNIPDYTNWANAATDIQTALNKAVANETVWVTNGNYTLPATITVPNGVTLKSVHGYNFTALNGRNAIRAMILNTGNAVADGFMITNCVAADGLQGGAVLISDDGGTLRNCFVCSNRQTSGWYGGGVGITTTNGLVDCCIISNNYSYKRGSGVGVQGGGTVRNSLIINNYNDYQGAGIYFQGAGGKADNCTVIGNIGIGIVIEPSAAGTGIVYNSISYLNNAAGDSNIALWGTGILSNNCFGTASALPAGNIKVDPQFINPAAGDYHLSSTSQCINAGINQAWMTDAVDMDGRRRLDKFNGRVDMGCYEYIFKGSMVEIR